MKVADVDADNIRLACRAASERDESLFDLAMTALCVQDTGQTVEVVKTLLAGALYNRYGKPIADDQLDLEALFMAATLREWLPAGKAPSEQELAWALRVGHRRVPQVPVRAEQVVAVMVLALAETLEMPELEAHYHLDVLLDLLDRAHRD